MLILNVTKIKESITAITGNTAIPSSMRQNVINFGLARLVAYSVGIPSDPVDNSAAYFNANNASAMETLSAVNETVVVDVSKIVTMALAVWRMRYDGVHNMFTKEAIEMSKIAIAEAEIYNFNKEIADVIATSEQFSELGRSIDGALSMFNPFVVGE